MSDDQAPHWSGHYWTLWPVLRAWLSPPRMPPARPWHLDVPDARFTSVRLHALLHEGSLAPERIVVVLHGLGGNALSPYVVESAAEAARRGWSCLALDLRGASMDGEDFYHAALTRDIGQVVHALQQQGYRQVYLLGYSLGGHLALSCAADPDFPVLASVAALCPPLDLAAAVRWIDDSAPSLYRVAVLHELKRMYRAVDQRGRALLPMREVQRIRFFRQWDEHVVAPRHGFASAEDYWKKASVAQKLEVLRFPTLLVRADHDPMVRPVPTLLPSSKVLHELRVSRGGHVGFPRRPGLGWPFEGSLQSQVLQWMEALPTETRAGLEDEGRRATDLQEMRPPRRIGMPDTSG